MVLCIAFLCGVLIGDVWLKAGIFVVAVIALLIFCWKWKTRLLMFGSFFLLLLWYVHSTFYSLSYEHRRNFLGDMVAWWNHQKVAIGTVGELISVSEFSHRYRMTVVSLDGIQVHKNFDIALSLPPNISLVSGDSVHVLGKFSFPRDTDIYDAEKQLWNRGLIAEFHSFHVDKTPPQKYSMFVRLRQWFDTSLMEIFPKKWHDLLSGILLGQRSSLDSKSQDELKASWLMHIMVVSGGNVIMLIVFLSLFIRMLHPWIRIVIIFGTIFAFVLLVWSDSAVWRAALMGVIGYSASLWWYRFPRFLLPLGVAVLLSVFNPLAIVYDIGLQLSFLSVVCIIAWWKKFTHFFAFLWPFFSEAFAMTVAATIGTFPITLFYFGTFSLVWPLANLFAAPALPILMYSGILTLLFHTFSPSLSYFFWYIPWIASTYLYGIIHIFGSQSWSMIHFDIWPYRHYFIACTMGILFILLVNWGKTHQ